jgi:hypothetical protein
MRIYIAIPEKHTANTSVSEIQSLLKLFSA